MISYADAIAPRGKEWADVARPAQLPPASDWRIWFLLGGRGSGKTRAASEFVCDQIRRGLGRRIAVIGKTAKDPYRHDRGRERGPRRETAVGSGHAAGADEDADQVGRRCVR